jgi:ABC-type lipoprotein export system ATPase subunit
MLSGGQSRSLMIADIAVISDSPIVLVDEIENAGIKKYEALKVLAGHGKIVLVVTHDPVLALLTDKRIIMKKGGMRSIIPTTAREKEIVKELNVIDMNILSLRERVRNGESIESAELYA